MRLEVLANADTVAARAATIIAEHARVAIAARGRFVMAMSGGRTPWMMLRLLAREKVPWSGVHVVQVDERIAPAGHRDRNLTHLREALLENAPLDPAQIYAMPVEAHDPLAAAGEYAKILKNIGGSPPALDLVHLGLGPDGHTASLVPGDPALQIVDRDVTITGLYHGRKRMTLTYPILNRARQLLWIVTGSGKANALRQLLKGDDSIPGGRIRPGRAVLLADRAAIGSDNGDNREDAA